MTDPAAHDPNRVTVEGSDRVYDRRKILLVLLLPLAMSLMAVSSVNVTLHTIETGLGASASDIQWVLSGFALAFGVALIPSGRAGDVLGRGGMFVVGLSIFVLASFACGLAPTPLALNAARLVQGIGAGMFNPQIMGMIQQYFTGVARAKAFSLFGLVISVSVAIGPLVAGAVINAVGDENGWRAAFLVNIPLGLAGLALAFVWFPFGRERQRRAARRAGEDGPRIDLDPVGAALMAVAVLVVMWPFIAHGQVLWRWMLVPVAALVLLGWIAWERRYERRGGQPMVDLHLFSFASFTNGTLVSGTMFLGAATVFVLVALYLQTYLHVSALETGLIGLPNAIVSGVAAVWAGRHVMQHGRRLVTVALASHVIGSLATIGVALLVARGLSFWWLALPLILHGLGMGMMGSANQTLSLEDVPPAEGGTAGGVKQTVERVAVAIGNAMITGVFFATQAAAGWTPALAVGLGVVAAVISVSLAIAVHDARVHRTDVR